MNRSIPFLTAILLSGGVAFAQAPARSAGSGSNASGAASQATMSFVQKVQAGSHFEIESGTLAGRQASDPKVKRFGQMMVMDHSKAAKDLTSAIKADKMAGLPQDTPMNADQTSKLNQLRALQGADFDRQYVQIMLQDHQEDAGLFDDYAKSGDDPKIKSFAKKTAAVIHRHLKAVQQMQGGMNKSAVR